MGRISQVRFWNDPQSESDSHHARPPWQYLRTTSRLSAHATLEVSSHVSIRELPLAETRAMADRIGRRNIFARHARDNDFYVARLLEMSGSTVIQVLPSGLAARDKMPDRVSKVCERAALLSSVFHMRRGDLHRRLGLREEPEAARHIMISGDCKALHTKSRRKAKTPGLIIDEPFCGRFMNHGLRSLVNACLATGDLADRLLMTSNWLWQSRQETALAAAIVKTAIAFETLLVFGSSEPLARSLSERSAFLLSEDPMVRGRIAAGMKHFYDARSRVVHGGRKKLRGTPLRLLEGADRLGLLLCVSVSNNLNVFSSSSKIKEWCDDVRWGIKDGKLDRPFPKRSLSLALKMLFPK